MDFILGLPPTKRGKVAIFVVVDRLSNMVHVEATRVTAEQTALTYEDRICRHNGIPQSVVSDRDPRFRKALWKALQEQLGTRPCMSIAAHP